MNTKKKRALFIDRDGTLVVEPPVDYQLDSLEKLQFMPKVFRNILLLCTSPWDAHQGRDSCSTPMCSDRTGMLAPKVPPFQVRCIGM